MPSKKVWCPPVWMADFLKLIHNTEAVREAVKDNPVED